MTTYETTGVLDGYDIICRRIEAVDAKAAEAELRRLTRKRRITDVHAEPPPPPDDGEDVMLVKSHYTTYGVTSRPTCADADGNVAIRANCADLPEAEWTAAEAWVAKQIARIYPPAAIPRTQRVIYLDPLTEQQPEGVAVLVEPTGPADVDGLQEWRVRFVEDQDGELFDRLINTHSL